MRATDSARILKRMRLRSRITANTFFIRRLEKPDAPSIAHLSKIASIIGLELDEIARLIR
jgi:hypothetical protein